MKKKQILLIGGGGHCKSCIEVIESTDEFEIAGIIDTKENLRQDVLGYSIIGTDEDLINLKQKYDYALISLGQTKSASLRKTLFKNIKQLGYQFPVIQASTAYVSKHSKISEGTIIMHHAIVNANVNIGTNCIINTKALLEHDVIVGDFCHISTNATINGFSKIGNNSFIGSCATINDRISITKSCVIGSNTTVNRSINESGLYVGSPVKKISR